MKYTKNPSKNLRWVRLKMGMSQAKLAKKIGKSQNCVSAYERGICKININVAEQVALLARENNIRCTVQMLHPIRKKYVRV